MYKPVLLTLLLLASAAGAKPDRPARPDPTLIIPYCATPPTLDGKLEPGEWDFAAGVGMLEAYPSGWPQVMRQEQATFYICWDEDYLYIAMESLESPVNRIMASCTQNDNMKIIGDDCIEIMVSPGDREAIQDPDFPTYYHAANAIGTLWDALFKPQRAEMHNSWQSGAELAHAIDGTRWICEMRIPLASIAAPRPHAGTVWRMNFDRTYYGYQWSAWNASGSFNDARIGGDVTFTRDQPAVRVRSVEDLIAAKLKVVMEAVNPTAAARDVTFRLEAVGYDEPGQTPEPVGTAEQTVTVAAGGRQEVALGRSQRLRRFNTLVLSATADDGTVLWSLQRDVQIPVPRIPPRSAPELPLVYVFPRFLPSIERLAVEMDATAWMKRTGVEDGAFRAEIRVAAREAPETPVLSAIWEEFKQGQAVARYSTADLAEGEYIVRVAVSESERELFVHEDWFEKRIFDWMTNPVGMTDEAPTPYSQLEVVAATGIRPWGRNYHFAGTGLPAAIVSQGKELLSGPVTIAATVDGEPAAPAVTQPFAVRTATGARVETRAAFTCGNLAVTLDSFTEYDGLIRFELTYGPTTGPVTLNRLRLRIPLTGKYCRFYSASGDREGTSIQGAVLPAENGKFFDSKEHTYAVGGYPTWAMLLWLADYDSYFCYAADSPRGWAVRDDAPAVEAFREGDEVIVWLNLVDRELTLTEPRTLEFAFQAGPTRPLPDGWRGVQFDGDPQAAPKTLSFLPQAGGGFSLYGGPYFVHPGLNPEQVENSRRRVAEHAARGPSLPVGYHRWPAMLKGHPATRVFRGEWGIDKFAWESTGYVSNHFWNNRTFGDDRELYTMFLVKPVPSYVNYLVYSYDRALAETDFHGTYDDTGYPIAIYDEDLGLGFIGDDGQQVASTGLWVYRERWKRAEVSHARHGRPNYTMDSQHVNAHYQPAYGFIGLWAPCERGYYNHYPDRDNLGFYGSLERYYAYNPSHAFGQIGNAVGMGSPQTAFNLLARDTRVMMLLALLHDQDVGTFGNRDLRTVYRLRETRNVFRQWEPEVSFTGYWAEPHPVVADNPEIRISLYQRPGSALFFVANISAAGRTLLRPDWTALGIDAATARAADPETGEALPLADGTLALALPHHGLRLVLIGDLEGYAWEPDDPGRDLPRPATVITALSDPLRGPEIAPEWSVDLHEGNSSAGIVDGWTYVQAANYGFGHLRRPLGHDNITVQCRILSSTAGSADTFFGGLGLWWDNGAYIRVIPGGNRRRFHYESTGARPTYGRDINSTAAARWYPYMANGLRFQLTPEAIRVFVSIDDKTWEVDHEIPRGEAFAGPPAWAILGSGGATGEEPFFKNVLAQHYAPQHAQRITLFRDFVVGKE